MSWKKNASPHHYGFYPMWFSHLGLSQFGYSHLALMVTKMSPEQPSMPPEGPACSSRPCKENQQTGEFQHQAARERCNSAPYVSGSSTSEKHPRARVEPRQTVASVVSVLCAPSIVDPQRMGAPPIPPVRSRADGERVPTGSKPTPAHE
jgi:hypothetical protein